MINYNVSSYGQVLRVDFGSDISGASTYSLTIEPEVGEKQELTPTLGTSDVEVGDETFSANQYVEYTTTEDQFKDYVGRYRMKAQADGDSTDYILFRVTA